MFTGLVECVGKVLATESTHPLRLRVRAPFAVDPLVPHDVIRLGDSVAIDGCCLTVVEMKGGVGLEQELVFEAATETLERTTIGHLIVGSAVNLERALRVGDRLGGHLVSGHVDAVGTIAVIEERGSATYVGVRLPSAIRFYVAAQGSITLAGVSLTVTSVEATEGSTGVETDIAYVGLIPHTLNETTFGSFKTGDAINIEIDVLARYVARLQQGHATESPGDAPLTRKFLEDKGFA